MHRSSLLDSKLSDPIPNPALKKVLYHQLDSTDENTVAFRM